MSFTDAVINTTIKQEAPYYVPLVQIVRDGYCWKEVEAWMVEHIHNDWAVSLSVSYTVNNTNRQPQRFYDSVPYGIYFANEADASNFILRWRK